MDEATPRTWQSRNQAFLVAALGRIKEALRGHAEDRQAAPDQAAAPVTEGGQEPETERRHHEMELPPALETLCEAFDLSPFERDVVLLCAGVELDSSFAPLCAAAQGDGSRTYPTFSLALAALPDAHWSAISPRGPLRRWRLIEVGSGSALTVSPLRLDETVLHYLAGVRTLDERLAALVELVVPPAAEDLSASQTAVAAQVAAVWSARQERVDMGVIQLCGPDPADRRAVAAAAAAAAGLRVAALPVELVPAAPAELDALVRLWEREAVLANLVLLIEGDAPVPDAADPSRATAVVRLTGRLGGPLIVSAREQLRQPLRRVTTFEVCRPTADERRTAWRAALATTADADPVAVEPLVSQFRLGLAAIRTAAAEAVARTAAAPEEGVERAAWDVCRVRSRRGLDELAQRIESAAGWDDLVLPAAQTEAVRRIALHVRQRTTVHDDWGFATVSERGLGISALFTGASGTGKTLASEVLANELRLDLYRIDLAGVVSKYIGETEKNLRRVFDAAEDGGAVLLFDEADALFGKRSEVKDSHDRYANIEVSYLLQRMEAYRGLAILTTNLKSALDPAFLRRIRFVVQLPFPDEVQRAAIWRRMFPPAAPTEGLDVSKLAKLNVAGGNIRNIALHAAFLAADAGGPVRMRHLLEAAREEYAKLERPLTEAEIGGWQ
jgi:hypothetical protein